MDKKELEAELKRLEALPESPFTKGRIMLMRKVLGKKKKSKEEGEFQYDWEKKGAEAGK